jgi:micrococcal nuclease
MGIGTSFGLFRIAGRILLAAAVLTAAGCAGGSGPSASWESVWEDYPELSGKKAEEAVVERVIDGDTFVTREGSRVRLIGVNAPEISGTVEYFGEEAANYAKRMLSGRTVWMFRDVSETDRYGRLLRFVFLPGDRLMFNERLVLEGYANAATYPPDVSLADRFREAERKARATEAGLWGDGAADMAADAADGPPAGGGASGDADGVRSDACPSPDIKGNINSRGEKIYHVPGSRYYDRTIAEYWFCTAEEAEAAGFRAPKNG